MLAQFLGDVPISAKSPRFLPRRVRHPGREKAIVREEIKRRGRRAAPALCFRPAAVTEQAEHNERLRNTQDGSLLLRCHLGYFPGGSSPQTRKYQRWR